MAEWIDVARIDELTPGNRKIIMTDVAEIAVFNLDGEFFAIEDVCTHDGGELASGVCDGDQIICPRFKTELTFGIPRIYEAYTSTVKAKAVKIKK